jgi:hypothetical protein
MPVRLGDTIEDHCSRCTRVTDHSIVALMNEEIIKVRCRTCNHEHKYRHGKGGRKKELDKKSAFDQVLAGIVSEQSGDTSEPKTARKGGKRAS